MTAPTVPTPGRIVNYVLPNGAIRPAIVVRVWDDGTVQLQQFTDQTNDGEAAGTVWRTSVVEGREPGMWHWPRPTAKAVPGGDE